MIRFALKYSFLLFLPGSKLPESIHFKISLLLSPEQGRNLKKTAQYFM